MTISSAQNFTRALGNGSATTFNFSFVADSASYVSVSYYTGSTLVTVLNTSLYTLFINPPSPGQIWGVGGVVVYPLTGSPIANGTSLLIQRTLPLTQTITISNQGEFAPEAIEGALDTLCMQIQQVSGTVAQSVVAQLGYTPMNGANNLSEIVSASVSRANLGLGTMGVQSANNIAVTGGVLSGVAITASSWSGGAFSSGSAIITGGAIDNTPIGLNTPAYGVFTTLDVIGGVTADGLALNNVTDAITLTTNNANIQIQRGGATPGSIDNMTIGGSNQADGSFNALSVGVDAISLFESYVDLKFQSASAGVILKRGNNGRTGTFVLTGTTAVTVNNTSIATSDVISYSLSVVGGTVGAWPTIKTITAATGFTVNGAVGDLSTYRYSLTKTTI